MSAITAKASRKMKKYAVLTREPRCFLGSFDFSWEQRKFDEVFDCTVPNNTLSRAELSYDEGTVLNVHYGDVLIKYGSVLDVQKDDIPRIPHRCREDFNGALLQDGDVIIADTAEDETTGKACEIGNLQGSAIVSGLHTMVCRPRNRMALGYLGYYLNSNAYHHQLLPLMQGIKVLSLSRSNIQKTSVSYPIAVKEQQLIAYYFSQLDNLITLHQRKCALLFSPFQAFISMMFTTSTFSWEQRKLSEMCGTFEYGLNAAAKEFDGKNKYIRITDIDDASREFLLSDLSSPDICLDGMSKYLLSSGDIVFARTGASVGKTYIYRENDGIVYFAGFLIRAKVNQDNDAEFVFQSTLSPSYEKYIRITSQRSGQPGVNAQEYGEYDLFAPSKEEQQRIGQFLRGIDNLITLHQRKFEKLTNVKKSMLEKMFPQNGSSYPEIRFKGFTDPWEQRKLGDIADIVGGGTPSTGNQSYWDGDIDWYAPAEIADQIYANSSQKKITGLGYENSSAKMLPPGTVLFTSRAGIGKTAILTRKGCTNQGFQSIVPHRGELDSYFIFSRTEELKRYGELVGAGSTFVEVSGKQMAVMELMMPPTMREQQTIGGFFQQLDHLITLHQRKPFLMKWRTSDANRNQTNRLVL